jgi:hypothetical protein
MGSSKSGIPSNFDVAISVAGADKQHALQLAEQLRAAGFAVFYYEFYPEYLWGKNRAITFDEIFRKTVSLLCDVHFQRVPRSCVDKPRDEKRASTSC